MTDNIITAVATIVLATLATALFIGFVWVLVVHPVWLGVAAFVICVVAIALFISWARST